MLEFQNTKAFLFKGYTQKWSEELFVVSKIKNTSSVDISSVIIDLNGEPITGSFYGKKFKKQIKNNYEYKKYLKERVINCTSNGKRMIVALILGLIRKTLNKNESILP